MSERIRQERWGGKPNTAVSLGGRHCVRQEHEARAIQAIRERRLREGMGGVREFS